jgi:hypothetical protein
MQLVKECSCLFRFGLGATCDTFQSHASNSIQNTSTTRFVLYLGEINGFSKAYSYTPNVCNALYIASIRATIIQASHSIPRISPHRLYPATTRCLPARCSLPMSSPPISAKFFTRCPPCTSTHQIPRNRPAADCLLSAMPPARRTTSPPSPWRLEWPGRCRCRRRNRCRRLERLSRPRGNDPANAVRPFSAGVLWKQPRMSWRVGLEAVLRGARFVSAAPAGATETEQRRNKEEQRRSKGGAKKKSKEEARELLQGSCSSLTSSFHPQGAGAPAFLHASRPLSSSSSLLPPALSRLSSCIRTPSLPNLRLSLPSFTPYHPPSTPLFLTKAFAGACRQERRARRREVENAAKLRAMQR